MEVISTTLVRTGSRMLLQDQRYCPSPIRALNPSNIPQ
jgi:hypothetical protein